MNHNDVVQGHLSDVPQMTICLRAQAGWPVTGKEEVRAMARKYLFADESGNFDFKDHHRYPGASKYFAVGTILFDNEEDRKALARDMLDLRHTMIDNGLPLNGSFHATEDKQAVRDGVFEVLSRNEFKADVTILEKARAQPHLYSSDDRFFQYAWYFHFKYFARGYFQPDDDLTVMTATLGTKAKQRLFRESVENVISQFTDFRVKRRVLSHPCASDFGLQAADYVLWAVMRDVEGGDDRARRLIEAKIASVYQPFDRGPVYYYGPKAVRSA